MNDFIMKLAGIPVSVRSLYPSTERFCHDYLSDDSPLVEVCVESSDIAAERERAQRDDAESHRVSPSYLELLALYRKIVEEFVKFDVILMHGAGIALNGSGVLFTAPSGTGKTTHIRLWQQKFAGGQNDFSIINGDKPLLRVEGNAIRMYGTPWQGKENLGCNQSVVLDHVVFLHRGETNRIVSMTSSQAVAGLLARTYRFDSAEKMAEALSVLDILARSVNFYRLSCNMGPEAAEAAFEGIYGSR